jgi:uncharacterized lipoprotein YmbA
MKFSLIATLSTVVALVIVGCSSTQDLRYLDSRAAQQLEIPPDFTDTSFDNETVLPVNVSDDVDALKPPKKCTCATNG